MKVDDLLNYSKIIENKIASVTKTESLEEYSLGNAVSHTTDQDLKTELKSIHDEMSSLDQRMKHVDLQGLHDMPNFSDFYRQYHELHNKIMVLNGHISIILDKYPFRN